MNTLAYFSAICVPLRLLLEECVHALDGTDTLHVGCVVAVITAHRAGNVCGGGKHKTFYTNLPNLLAVAVALPGTNIVGIEDLSRGILYIAHKLVVADYTAVCNVVVVWAVAVTRYVKFVQGVRVDCIHESKKHFFI